ncbi:MAG: oligosaccharide flippase family protein [Proteobacteria bacterium]|nr:oligosaccharide flippase family protein [Pseudomonadota bacterium]
MAASPPRRLSLRQNFIWSFAGNALVNGAKWIMFIVLAKLADERVVGDFSLALAVATPLSALAQMNLRLVLITDTKDSHPFGVYHALRLLTTIVAVAASVAVALAVYGPGSRAVLILLVATAQGVTALRDIWLGLAHKHERLDIPATGNAVEAAASTVLFCAALMATNSIHTAVAGIVAGRLGTLVIYDVPTVRDLVAQSRLAPDWRLSALKQLFTTTLPLGVAVACISLNSNVPRYFIDGVLGENELAYFAAIAYFVLAGQMIVAALGRSASPRLAALYTTERRAYGVLVIKMLLVAAVIGTAGVIGALLVGEIFLALAYTPEYAKHSHILVLLMGAAAVSFLNTFLGVAISAARFFKLQSTITAVLVAVTTLSSAVLIPRHGLDGAAWATIIATCANLLMNGAVFFYVYRNQRP